MSVFLKEQIAYQLDLILCESKSRFDLRHFKTLDPLQAKSIEYDHYGYEDEDNPYPTESTSMLDYAREHLKELGEGSSRAVFYLSNRYVLKLAINDAGYAQNEAEVEVFTNPATKPIIAKIYDFDSDYAWIISEVVRELTTAREFTEKSEVNLNNLITTIRRWDQYLQKHFKEPDKDSMDPVAYGHALLNYEATKKIISHPLFEALKSLVKSSKIDLDDVQDAGHWGMTADGRLVILDYGFTRAVKDKFY